MAVFHKLATVSILVIIDDHISRNIPKYFHEMNIKERLIGTVRSKTIVLEIGQRDFEEELLL